MKERSNDLFERLKSFSLQIVQLHTTLPKTGAAKYLGGQLLRSGTSSGAQYAEARRAKSDRDFIRMIEDGLAELEETGYWLELLAESGIVRRERLITIRLETEELVRIFVTMAKHTRAGERKR